MTRSEAWSVVPYAERDAASNLAETERLLAAVATGEIGPTLRWYGYVGQAVIIGVGQALGTVASDLEARGFTIVRRLSGGAAVLATRGVGTQVGRPLASSPARRRPPAGGRALAIRRHRDGLTCRRARNGHRGRRDASAARRRPRRRGGRSGVTGRTSRGIRDGGNSGTCGIARTVGRGGASGRRRRVARRTRSQSPPPRPSWPRRRRPTRRPPRRRRCANLAHRGLPPQRGMPEPTSPQLPRSLPP